MGLKNEPKVCEFCGWVMRPLKIIKGDIIREWECRACDYTWCDLSHKYDESHKELTESLILEWFSSK